MYKRWWFWVIIGVVCAFAVVLAVFTIRGFRQWRRFITLEELVRDQREVWCYLLYSQSQLICLSPD